MSKRKRPERRNTEKNAGNAGESRTSRSRKPHRGGARPPSAGNRTAADSRLYGLHAVREALANPKRTRGQLYATRSVAADLQDRGLDARFAPEILEGPEIAGLLPPGAVHQGIAFDTPALIELDITDIPAMGGPVALLDQVTDPHNVGAILRSAAVFGVKALVMTERNSPPQSGVLAKSASGALEHVGICRVGNLARAMDQLVKDGFTLIGLDGEADHELANIDVSGPCAIALGAEGPGLRRLTRERCDWMAKLPAHGPMRSLNVSNAAAVAFYELSRKSDP